MKRAVGDPPQNFSERRLVESEAIMQTGNLRIDRDSLAEVCRRHHVRRLSLFGSVLRGDFRPDSDVDVLVEYDPAWSPGWDIVDLENELGRVFGGRKVDLVNRKYLNHRLKDRILTSAVVQYEARDGEG
jgi:predicted nucleotidyltransferase